MCCWRQVTGTPGFRAPEVMDVGWGKAADTYAFGIIAWQLLTGVMCCLCDQIQSAASLHLDCVVLVGSQEEKACAAIKADGQARMPTCPHALSRLLGASHSCSCCSHCCFPLAALPPKQERSPSHMTGSGACTCPTPTCCECLSAAGQMPSPAPWLTLCLTVAPTALSNGPACGR